MGQIALEGKKILVTGASGYLGKHLVNRLRDEGAILYSLISRKQQAGNEFEFSIDLNDKEAVQEVVAEVSPHFVYHLAANLDRNRQFDNYHTICRDNVDATLNLLEALKTVDYENFIFTSTSEVYGDQESPLHEEMKLKPASPYSLTKLYAEELIRTHAAFSNKKYTILRLFNFYGEGMSTHFFIPQLLASLNNGDYFEMTGGEQYRDFMYIDDVAEALVLAAQRKEAIGQTFNVCSGRGVALKDLALEVAKHFPLATDRIKIGAIPYRKNEIWNMIGSNTKIIELLGFQPMYNLREGVQLTINN